MTIPDRQNSPASIERQAAQRQLYTEAKRLRRLRVVGSLGLAAAGPVVALVWPDTSAWLGAVAGLWLALSRIILRPLERHLTELAASVQEEFDLAVLDLPRNQSRGPGPSGQTVSAAAKRHLKRKTAKRTADLTGWYPDTGPVRAPYDALICQQASIEWSAGQHRNWLQATSVAAVLWGVALVAFALVQDYSLATFLVSLLLPSIPAFVDAADAWDAHRAHLRRQAGAEEAARTAWNQALTGAPVGLAECRTIQDAVWDLRQELVHVPDWFYGARRKVNEEAMKAAAAARVSAAVAAGLT